MKVSQLDQSESSDLNNLFYERNENSNVQSKLTDRGDTQKDNRASPDIFIQSFHRLSQLEKVA